MRFQPVADARVIVALAVMLLACAACDGLEGRSSDRGETSVEQVLAATDCAEPSCISAATASEVLGFAVFEPLVLPEGFSLASRALHPANGADAPPGAARASDASLKPEQPRLVITYRFDASVNVPAIVLTESRPASQGTDVELLAAREGCAEVVEDRDRRVFYVNGFASKEPGAVEGRILVCSVEEAPARDAHTVLVAIGDVLVEMLAFPESGVSKEEMLALANSLAEAE